MVGRDAAVEREPRGILFLGEVVKVRLWLRMKVPAGDDADMATIFRQNSLDGRQPNEVDVAGLVYGGEKADQLMNLGDGVLRAVREAFGKNSTDGFVLGYVGPLVDARIPEQGGQDLDRAVDVLRGNLGEPIYDAERVGWDKAGLQHVE